MHSFEVRRNSQVEKAQSPRKESSERQALTKESCAMSSARSTEAPQALSTRQAEWYTNFS